MRLLEVSQRREISSSKRRFCGALSGHLAMSGKIQINCLIYVSTYIHIQITHSLYCSDLNTIHVDKIQKFDTIFGEMNMKDDRPSKYDLN